MDSLRSCRASSEHLLRRRTAQPVEMIQVPRAEPRRNSVSSLAGYWVASVREVSYDTVERKTAPSVPSGAGVPPTIGTPQKHPLERILSHSRARLGHGARGHRSRRALPRASKLKMSDDLHDRSVAHERHADHQPDDLLCGEPSSPQGREARRFERLLDPVGIEMLGEDVELGGCERRRCGKCSLKAQQ